MKNQQCQSYLPERGLYGPCRDGFPQTGACTDGRNTPTCCNEKICGRLYGHTGGKPPEHMLTPNAGGKP